MECHVIRKWWETIFTSMVSSNKTWTALNANFTNSWYNMGNNWHKFGNTFEDNWGKIGFFT